MLAAQPGRVSPAGLGLGLLPLPAAMLLFGLARWPAPGPAAECGGDVPKKLAVLPRALPTVLQTVSSCCPCSPVVSSSSWRGVTAAAAPLCGAVSGAAAAVPDSGAAAAAAAAATLAMSSVSSAAGLVAEAAGAAAAPRPLPAILRRC